MILFFISIDCKFAIIQLKKLLKILQLLLHLLPYNQTEIWSIIIQVVVKSRITIELLCKICHFETLRRHSKFL